MVSRVRCAPTTTARTRCSIRPASLPLTPAYASREMLNGDNAEPRDDIYSLGIVIYLVLTGHHPYGRLSAQQASQEGLKPDRSKRLNRRQWRVLERCLQFHRQGRPASVAEVLDGLDGTPPWRSKPVLAAAGAALLAMALPLGMDAMQDGAVEAEVREEVRKTTLLDVQLERLRGLLANGTFDASWDQQLWRELQTLYQHDVDGSSVGPVTAAVVEAFAVKLRDEQDLNRAITLLEAARKYGDVRELQTHVSERLRDQLDALLAEPYSPLWADHVVDVFRQAQRAGVPALAGQQTLLTDTLEHHVERAVDDGDLQAAAEMLRLLRPLAFDLPTLDALDGAVASASRAAQAEARAQAQRTARDYIASQVEAASGGSCMRLDLPAMRDTLARLTQELPAQRRYAERQVADTVATCVTRLGELDRDRAHALLAGAASMYGALPGLAELKLDPCGMRYLVGNGLRAGGAGVCTDEIAASAAVGSATDPTNIELVVVPGQNPGERFAISRLELAWSDLAAFCEATGNCMLPVDPSQPVTSAPVTLIEQFATWLSTESGYTYRLPTRGEWQRAVGTGEPDPNRNCRVRVGSIDRGGEALPSHTGTPNEFGLLHVLGNVREVVADGDTLHAMGGGYADPIDACVVDGEEMVSTDGDAQTGYRLVREVS